MTRRLLPLALCMLALLATTAQAQENDSSPGIASPAPAGAEEPRANLADLEDEVMCPICGTALGLSGAPQADREREFIRELIAEGKTKDEIKDALVAEYGEEVLAVPGDDGFDLAAWLVPAVAILLAAAAILVGLRRWRRADGAPSRPAPQRPSGSDQERLSSDLSRYDL